jgi:uncharacterized membrane protein
MMRRRTVKFGLDLLIVAIAMVTTATFFHEQLALLFSLSSVSEARLVFLGLFWGGVCGCLGISVTIVGLLRATTASERVSLVPSLVVLVATIILFIFLLYASFTTPEPPRVRPGESITI